MGDVVRLTSALAPGLFSAALPIGSVGVVSAVTNGSLVVDVDAGFAGTVSVTARPHQCRVVERGTGVIRFRSRTGVRNAMRLGALIVVVAPFIHFVASWWLATGSLDGLLENLPLLALESGAEAVGFAFADPVRAVLSLGLGTLLWWLAFGPPRRI
ncbi:hypothetical protein [Microbacterium sp. SLBN-111]|uniref:hypothetical protein n=1 Tax=Microbacterium sp. SLBN-111 TaxID=3377733 RepID=UPI003C71610E